MQGWYAEYCENIGGSESDLFWDIRDKSPPPPEKNMYLTPF